MKKFIYTGSIFSLSEYKEGTSFLGNKWFSYYAVVKGVGYDHNQTIYVRILDEDLAQWLIDESYYGPVEGVFEFELVTRCYQKVTKSGSIIPVQEIGCVSMTKVEEGSNNE